MTWKSDNEWPRRDRDEWPRRDRDYDSRSRPSSSTEIIIGASVFGVFVCIFIVFAIYQCCKKASKKAAKVDRAYYNKNGNSHKEGTMPPQPSYMPSHPPPTGILHSQKSQRLPSTSSGSRHQTHQQPYPPPQLPATASGHSNAPYPLPMPSSPMPAAASYPPSASPYPPAAPLPMMQAGVTDQQHISPYPPLPAENAYPPISPYPPAPPPMTGMSGRSHGAYPPSTPQPIAVMPSAPYPTNSPVNSAGKGGGGSSGWNSQALQPNILAGEGTNLGMPPPLAPSATGSRSHAKVHLQPAVIHPAPPPSKHARSLRSNRDSNQRR